MVQDKDDTDAWEQQKRQLADEIFEKLAIALGEYINHQ
jgi:hypothetical protein